jgi:hypothetical protein
VAALSARKVRGKPIARIAMEVTLRVAEGEPMEDMRKRARAVALDFLDVA